VGPIGAGNTVPAQNLKKLADATGGRAFILETPQSFTPIFQMLADQGQQYRLSYRSSLSSTGQNKLSLAVKLPDGSSLSAAEATFPLRVEAPQVALGSLPPSVVRVAPAFDAPLRTSTRTRRTRTSSTTSVSGSNGSTAVASTDMRARPRRTRATA